MDKDYSELEQAFETSFELENARLRPLEELLSKYYADCEAYDMTICTGPITKDGIMPVTQRERNLVNRNAIRLHHIFLHDARLLNFDAADILEAKRRNTRHPYLKF